MAIRQSDQVNEFGQGQVIKWSNPGFKSRGSSDQVIQSWIQIQGGSKETDLISEFILEKPARILILWIKIQAIEFPSSQPNF